MDSPWWVLVFFVIGAVATLTAVVSLFFALGRRPQRMWTDEIGAVDSSDFLRPIAALLNVPVRKGGHAELLDNGDDFFPAMYADFASARRSINFMAYIWEPGRVSDEMFAALIAATRRGVQVRILLDGLGGIRCPDEDIERLRDAGGQVAVFRALRIGKLLRFHRRNHRRAIVIDGRTAYTGGAAVGDKWLGNARNPDEWRDSMVRVTGCLAENLQSAFAELWAFCAGELLTGDSFFPDDLDEMDEKHADVRSFGVISSPSNEEHPLRLLFFLTFLAARERLWIASPYFVPDKHLRSVVARRARAGVDVRVLLPNKHTDAVPIRRASHSYYSELLDAGVRVFEYQPTMMHNKTVSVDGKFAVVGSANMDVRSKELNEENVLGILEPEFAGQIEQSFEKDLTAAKEIDRVEWRKRGLGARIIERICVLFAEQY
ncbi:phospholipase D-like domain-containing protein [soil metagenome]